jgi:glutamine synthetase
MTTKFIQKFGIWNDEQQDAANALAANVNQLGLRQVRIAWCDQHGILRGKTVEVDHFLSTLRSGKDFQLATLVFDTTNHSVVSLFGAAGFGDDNLTGLGDGVLVPDPTTWKIIPWADRTGWILCDLYYSNGERCPFDTRGVLASELNKLSDDGFQFTAGIEMEFHITKLVDPKLSFADSRWPPAPPMTQALSHGYQYLSENRGDEGDRILGILRDNLVELGMPLATVEDEWGPGQVEFTFEPTTGVTTADDAVLIRGAIKQLCRRNGYHATFMCRPAFADVVSSGWHLHQSLATTEFANIFPGEGDNLLSKEAMAYTGGLLENAAACSVLTTPTINGYKRYRSDSFAPDRIAWAEENRAAMVRVSGARGDSNTHLENRVGEPAANPYLYLASQIVSGRDGIRRNVDPGPSADEPYAANARTLPKTLERAVDEFEKSDLLRAELGEPFVNYLTTMKRHEVQRFNEAVTDWEQREYFEIF